MATFIDDIEALLAPIALGGAFYGINPNQPPRVGPDGETPLPFIVFTRIVSTDNVTLEGASGLQNTRLQVDIFAPRIEDAELVRKQVDLSFANGPIEAIPISSQDVFEDPVRLWRIIREFSVWYTETEDVQTFRSQLSAPGVGETFTGALSESWSHTLTVSGVGAVSADGFVDGTNDPAGLTGWTPICSLDPSGTDTASDTPVPPVALHSWRLLRHRLVSITGAAGTTAQFSTTGF